MNVKLLFKNVLLLSVFLLTFTTSIFAQDTDVKNDVMFQGFWWDSYQDPNVSAEGGLYNYLKARAPQLQAAGFDVVWTPPPSQGDGMGYFPKQLFNYNNAHGSQSQLTSMLAEFTSRGIMVWQILLPTTVAEQLAGLTLPIQLGIVRLL